ncbi:uncharacterized protein ACRADG_012948 isoform 2-T2 [Cochliomyia hominivorax]
MLKILFSIIGVSAALKCHICDNYDTAKCRNIENSNNTFLKECKQNETKCASLESRLYNGAITRICVLPTWTYDNEKYNVVTCDTDGCNTIKFFGKLKRTEIVKHAIILRANLHILGFIGFLLLLCVIYCVAIVCSKKYYNDYEKETEECDQYYVKENKVDLKDETIQVESIKEKNND